MPRSLPSLFRTIDESPPHHRRLHFTRAIFLDRRTNFGIPLACKAREESLISTHVHLCIHVTLSCLDRGAVRHLKPMMTFAHSLFKSWTDDRLFEVRARKCRPSSAPRGGRVVYLNTQDSKLKIYGVFGAKIHNSSRSPISILIFTFEHTVVEMEKEEESSPHGTPRGPDPARTRMTRLVSG